MRRLHPVRRLRPPHLSRAPGEQRRDGRPGRGRYQEAQEDQRAAQVQIAAVQPHVPSFTPLDQGFDLPELLRATAWRTSALKADSSTSPPSWMSIARRAFPSRLELKRRAGSFRDAPLAKVSFTTFL